MSQLHRSRQVHQCNEIQSKVVCPRLSLRNRHAHLKAVLSPGLRSLVSLPIVVSGSGKTWQVWDLVQLPHDTRDVLPDSSCRCVRAQDSAALIFESLVEVLPHTAVRRCPKTPRRYCDGSVLHPWRALQPANSRDEPCCQTRERSSAALLPLESPDLYHLTCWAAKSPMGWLAQCLKLSTFSSSQHILNTCALTSNTGAADCQPFQSCLSRRVFLEAN